MARAPGAAQVAELIENMEDALTRACSCTRLQRVVTAACAWHLAGEPSRRDAMLAEADAALAGGGAASAEYLAGVRRAMGC